MRTSRSVGATGEQHRKLANLIDVHAAAHEVPDQLSMWPASAECALFAGVWVGSDEFVTDSSS